jgi:hypothetical protein
MADNAFVRSTTGRVPRRSPTPLRPISRIASWTAMPHGVGSIRATSSSTTVRWNTATAPPTRDLAPVKKSIYSLIDLREILLGCNQRYLVHLSSLDDFSAGVRALDRLTKRAFSTAAPSRGVSFFDPTDAALLRALQNPRVNIAGIRRAHLLPALAMLSPGRLSAGSAALGWSNASLEPTATISPRLVVRPRRPRLDTHAP